MTRAALLVIALASCQRALCALDRGTVFCHQEAIYSDLAPTDANLIITWEEVCYCVIDIRHSWRFR